MPERPLPFLEDDNLIALPSPKMTPSDRMGVHRWHREYAAFSEKFAQASIEALMERGDETIFDPFLGSGTSLVAATKFNLKFFGSELSPFSALLSRTKAAYKADNNLVFSILGNVCHSEIDQTETIASFSKCDIEYAANVVANIEEMCGKSGKSLLQGLIMGDGVNWDSYRVALLSVILSARNVSKLSQGSNPVWFKHQDTDVVSDGKPSLSELSVVMAKEMMKDLAAASIDSNDVNVICADARSLPFESEIFDILITSPPYLNRLDYVVNQLPEILLLSLVEKQDLELLKRNMIGTTKIVEKGEPSAEWGRACNDILKEIWNHKSKASNTYYYWNYYKYFKDMYAVFGELRRLARGKAKGLLVVQNSHYKELQIPVADIFMEMGASLNISMQEVKNIIVKSHMGLLSPEQRLYASKKTLNESVLFLGFA